MSMAAELPRCFPLYDSGFDEASSATGESSPQGLMTPCCSLGAAKGLLNSWYKGADAAGIMDPGDLIPDLGLSTLELRLLNWQKPMTMLFRAKGAD